MFEIKELFHAHAGCTYRQNHAPGYLFICIFQGLKLVQKFKGPVGPLAFDMKGPSSKSTSTYLENIKSII